MAVAIIASYWIWTMATSPLAAEKLKLTLPEVGLEGEYWVVRFKALNVGRVNTFITDLWLNDKSILRLGDEARAEVTVGGETYTWEGGSIVDSSGNEVSGVPLPVGEEAIVVIYVSADRYGPGQTLTISVITAGNQVFKASVTLS
ncbi:MAG: hypothetical protein DRJ57_03050 [Thermoprotei archaeon]|nr:MAG: hypothetical protein DRJ57_03050 [Thermoprotei archaeon]